MAQKCLNLLPRQIKLYARCLEKGGWQPCEGLITRTGLVSSSPDDVNIAHTIDRWFL